MALNTGSLVKGLIGYWPLTNKWQDASSNVLDRTPNGNKSSTITGDPTVGASSTAYDGDDAHKMGTDSSLNFTGDYSVVARMSTSNATAATRHIVSRNNDGANAGFSLFMNSSNRIQLFHIVQGTDEGGLVYNSIDGTTTGVVNTGSTFLIIATFESGVGSELFINNVSQGTASTTTSPISTFTQELMFAAQDSVQPRYYTGNIWDVALCNKVLSSTERNLIEDKGNGNLLN